MNKLKETLLIVLISVSISLIMMLNYVMYQSIKEQYFNKPMEINVKVQQ